MGGEEAPCQSKGVLAAIEEETGRPCPRVELDEENADVSKLLTFVLSESLRPLAPAVLDATFPPRARGARSSALRRLSTAVNHPEVVAVLYPEAKPHG